MDDESLVESHLLRRLYRILNLPTPEIVDPEKESDNGGRVDTDPEDRFTEIVEEANKTNDKID